MSKDSEEARLADELENFREIAAHLKPSSGDFPRIAGIDIAGMSIPLAGAVGGDHVVYIDFNRRYNLDRRIARARKRGRDEVADTLERLRIRAGILLADVSGHRMTDGLVTAMLHQAFLLGALYELDRYGEITTRLFEHLNTRFYQTTAVHKYFTMIYGEINTEGRFRFLSAAHQPPMVFSREFGKLMKINPDRLVSFPPVGMLPSRNDLDDHPSKTPDPLVAKKNYEVNEIDLLSQGDILLLMTDGVAEHADGDFLKDVEALMRDCADCTSREICERVRTAALERAKPEDDMTVVVIRKLH